MGGKGLETLSKPIGCQGGRILFTCTISSLAPLGAKGSPPCLATHPLPTGKHRQPVFVSLGSGLFCSPGGIAEFTLNDGASCCALARCTVDRGLPWTLVGSISALAWPEGHLHCGRDEVLAAVGTVEARAGLLLHWFTHWCCTAMGRRALVLCICRSPWLTLVRPRGGNEWPAAVDPQSAHSRNARPQ